MKTKHCQQPTTMLTSWPWFLISWSASLSKSSSTRFPCKMTSKFLRARLDGPGCTGALLSVLSAV